MSNVPRVLVFAGTRKGAFIFESDLTRQKWQAHGPFFAGWALQHMKYDRRDGRLYASLDHMVYGSNIHVSPDLGKTWEMIDGPHFPESDERTVARYWHVQPGHESQPDRIWAGVDPGSLFRSDDGGMNWKAVDGINNHLTRDEWSAVFKDEDVCYAPVNYINEALRDPQVVHRNMVLEFDHTDVGRVRHLGIPIKLSETPGCVRTLGVPIGTHTHEVLQDLGYSTNDIDELRRQGAFG